MFATHSLGRKNLHRRIKKAKNSIAKILLRTAMSTISTRIMMTRNQVVVTREIKVLKRKKKRLSTQCQQNESGRRPRSQKSKVSKMTTREEAVMAAT